MKSVFESTSLYCKIPRVMAIVPIVFLLLSIQIFCPAIARATAIVAVRTPNEVYIGADSKTINERDRAVSQCKVNKTGGLYYAFTGMPVIIKANFNAYDLAVKNLDTTGSIEDRVKAYDKDIMAKLRTAIEYLRTKETKIFEKWYAQDVRDRVALQVIIAGVENSIPVIYTLEYRILSQINQPVVIEPYPENYTGKMAPKQLQVVFLGVHDAIDKLLSKKDYMKMFDAVPTINEWISAEASFQPDIVSKPVDIIRIGADKTVWIQHKKICPEIDSSTQIEPVSLQ